MLTKKQAQFIRDELATAKNPLFFYDGDGDGLASFLLLYRINREGKGIALRTASRVDGLSLRKIDELNPDKVFVLDNLQIILINYIVLYIIRLIYLDYLIIS